MTTQKLTVWSNYDSGRLTTSMVDVDDATGAIVSPDKVQGTKLAASANNFSTMLSASSSLASDLDFTLPATLGNSNEVLVTDGTGVLSWSSTGTGTVDSVGVTTATGSTLLITGDTTITESGTVNISLNSELDALGQLSVDGLVARTDTGAYTSRTITTDTNLTVTDGDGKAGNPALGLAENITVKQLGYTVMTTVERDALTVSEGTIVCTKDATDAAELSVFLGASWFTIATL